MLIRTPGPHRTLEKMRRKREWRRRRSRARQRPAAARKLLDGLSAVAVSILGLRRYLESPLPGRGNPSAAASFGDYPCTRLHGALFESDYYPRIQSNSP